MKTCFPSCALAAAALALAAATPALFADDLKTETKPLLSFESRADLANAEGAHATGELVPAETPEGGKALLLKFDEGTDWPAFHFHQKPAADYRGYGGLVFDAYNPGANTVAFFVRMDSSVDGKEQQRTGKGSIEPKERITFVLPFGTDPSSLGMKSLPGLGDYRSMGKGGEGPYDLGKIIDWQFFAARPHAPLELVIDNIRLVPGEKEDFDKIVDKYGQYTKQDWPGKIHTDADFAAQNAQEQADLKVKPMLPDRDKYGGWLSGPALKATGFFRTEKYEGKWAFVDPEGHLFLSFGPTSVGPGQTTPFTGREKLFSVLPTDDPLLAKNLKGKGALDFQAANLERKYGPDFKTAFYARTYDRLIAWGFTTIGAFSSWDTLNNGRVPYTATVWAGDKHARIANSKEGFDDPYDPKFAADIGAAAQAQGSKVKDDPFCIGYFVGNEEKWGFYRSGPASYYSLVFGALKAKADASPAKGAFLNLLKQKYETIDKLNASWKTGYASWEAMAEPLLFKDKDGYSPGLIADCSMLLSHFAEQYFRVVSEALKKADPNHLYLGCRFAGYSPEVLAAADKYVDVFSFNLYRVTIEAKEWGILDPYDKPVVIGEFHFGATDRGMFDVGLIGVKDQAARGRAYQNYLRSILTQPKFVGAHWFQYVDQPLTGRGGDGENGNVGLISGTDTPFMEFIDAAREIHGEMYKIRWPK